MNGKEDSRAVGVMQMGNEATLKRKAENPLLGLAVLGGSSPPVTHALVRHVFIAKENGRKN